MKFSEKKQTFFCRAAVIFGIFLLCVFTIHQTCADKKLNKLVEYDEANRHEAKLRYSKKNNDDSNHKPTKKSTIESDDSGDDDDDENDKNKIKKYKVEAHKRKVNIKKKLQDSDEDDDSDETCSNCDKSDDTTDEDDESDEAAPSQRKISYIKKFSHEKHKDKPDKKIENILKIHKKSAGGSKR